MAIIISIILFMYRDTILGILYHDISSNVLTHKRDQRMLLGLYSHNFVKDNRNKSAFKCL